ncbi:hypothetical protein [Corynebacterium variabile]|uniref:hypothetical protein n=1 Tax=Corynebacterium variabile TaxID=1727 RepID=UPI003A92C1B6
MTAPTASSSSHSSLGHFIVPDWHQTPDEQQFAKALLRIATSTTSECRSAQAKRPSEPQKGESA